MLTTDTHQLTEAVEDLRNAAVAALQDQSPDDFSLVEQQISRLEAQAREIQQAMWADQAKTAIKHLESGEALTEADLDVIRIFLISDAERYVELENNFNDWVNELNRLLDDVGRRAQMLDPHGIAEIRGVLKDAIRLVPDIRNFLEEKRRIDQFQSALHTLDEPARQMMALILREQLSSDAR